MAGFTRCAANRTFCSVEQFSRDFLPTSAKVMDTGDEAPTGTEVDAIRGCPLIERLDLTLTITATVNDSGAFNMITARARFATAHGPPHFTNEVAPSLPPGIDGARNFGSRGERTRTGAKITRGRV